MNTRYNQTQFSLEEPFFQQPQDPVEPIQPKKEEPVTREVKKPPLKVFIVAGLIVFLLLIKFIIQ